MLTKCSPLSSTLSPPSTRTSSIKSPLAKSQDIDPFDQQGEARAGLLDDDSEQTLVENVNQNLSFVLDAAIYHPLSQNDIPAPFRESLVGPPPKGASIDQIMLQLESLVAKCDFIGAAHFSAMCLTGGFVQPTDHVSVFRLLATRYSCLEIMGQTVLAAQEAKALEDLSSDFYYAIPTVSDALVEANNGVRPLARHIMPFPLRIQAIRLQNIGFSDPRRGVTALYDLGLEAREHITSPYIREAERNEWRDRLKSLVIHVVNALIELGDLDCAQRTLAQSKPQDIKEQAKWVSRMVLMLVKLGQFDKAQAYIDMLGEDDKHRALLSSVLASADNKVADAATLLENAIEKGADQDIVILARQNLAVAYLYLGRITDARGLLQDLIDQGHSFQSLIVNLATIFDLTTDKSRGQKIKLIEQLASSPAPKRPLTNADFKL